MVHFAQHLSNVPSCHVVGRTKVHFDSMLATRYGFLLPATCVHFSNTAAADTSRVPCVVADVAFITVPPATLKNAIQRGRAQVFDVVQMHKCQAFGRMWFATCR